MKAAIASQRQVTDRIARMRALGLTIALELHTFGPRDLSDRAVRQRALRLRETTGADLVVHVPPQDPVALLREDFDAEQVRRTIELAQTAGAEGVVIHRYLRLRRPRPGATVVSRPADGESFIDLLEPAILDRGPLTIHVENLGFFHLRPRHRRSFLVGPLDHFFPWDQDAFVASVERRGHRRILPMVDVAHAALSANMFNLLRRDHSRFASDTRFAHITAGDLERVQELTPADFIHARASHVHCSDAFVATADPDWRVARPRAATVWRWLTSEGLPLGRGNIDFAALMRAVSRNVARSRTTVVAEIASGPAQARALVTLMSLTGEALAA